MIGEYLENEALRKVASRTLREEVLGLKIPSQAMADGKKIADIMASLGWSRPKMVRIGQKAVAGYRLEDAARLAELDARRVRGPLE